MSVCPTVSVLRFYGCCHPCCYLQMQNQAAVEALYSATFVEDYLDYVENVPDDIQRFHTMLRELDLRQHQVCFIDT